MTKKLPYKNFRWVSRKVHKKINWEETDLDGDVGYALRVDLEYPENLHLAHNSFPLAPEHMEINHDMLSDYSKGWEKSLLKCFSSFN